MCFKFIFFYNNFYKYKKQPASLSSGYKLKSG